MTNDLRSIPGLFQLLVDRALNKASGDSVVHWAEALLATEHEVPSLAQLASYSLPAHREDVEPCFNAVLAELKIQVPPSRQLVTAYLRQIVEDIIAAKLSPSSGASTVNDVYQQLGHPGWLIEWTELESDDRIRDAAKDLRNDLEVREVLEKGDVERSRPLSQAQVKGYVRSLFDESALISLSFDQLKAVGVLLAKSGHGLLDEDVVHIALELDNSKRDFIASALLCGLWSPSRTVYIEQSTASLFKKLQERKGHTKEVQAALNEAQTLIETRNYEGWFGHKD